MRIPAGHIQVDSHSACDQDCYRTHHAYSEHVQAEDRAHRIGQKREVLVLVLVSAGTIEQVILDRAQQKKEIDAKVIQVGHPGMSLSAPRWVTLGCQFQHFRWVTLRYQFQRLGGSPWEVNFSILCLLATSWCSCPQKLNNRIETCSIGMTRLS